MRYKKVLMILVMKKEQMCRKSRNSLSKTQRTKINHLRRQKQFDQVEKQKIGLFIA